MDNSTLIFQLLECIRELVALKEMKDEHGKTDEYLKRQPMAWNHAKRLVYQHRYYGAKASKIDAPKVTPTVSIKTRK